MTATSKRRPSNFLHWNDVSIFDDGLTSLEAGVQVLRVENTYHGGNACDLRRAERALINTQFEGYEELDFASLEP